MEMRKAAGNALLRRLFQIALCRIEFLLQARNLAREAFVGLRRLEQLLLQPLVLALSLFRPCNRCIRLLAQQLEFLGGGSVMVAEDEKTKLAMDCGRRRRRRDRAWATNLSDPVCHGGGS